MTTTMWVLSAIRRHGMGEGRRLIVLGVALLLGLGGLRTAIAEPRAGSRGAASEMPAVAPIVPDTAEPAPPPSKSWFPFFRSWGTTSESGVASPATGAVTVPKPSLPPTAPVLASPASPPATSLPSSTWTPGVTTTPSRRSPLLPAWARGPFSNSEETDHPAPASPNIPPRVPSKDDSVARRLADQTRNGVKSGGPSQPYGTIRAADAYRGQSFDGPTEAPKRTETGARPRPKPLVVDVPQTISSRYSRVQSPEPAKPEAEKALTVAKRRPEPAAERPTVEPRIAPRRADPTPELDASRKALEDTRLLLARRPQAAPQPATREFEAARRPVAKEQAEYEAAGRQ